MIMRLTILVLHAANVAFFAASGTAFAQSNPNRPVEIIVSTSAGTSADTLARQLAASGVLGQKVTVVNMAGGRGAVAADHVQRAVPDGSKLLLWDSQTEAFRGMRAARVATIAIQRNRLFGLLAPVGTPESVLVRLHAAINKALSDNSELKSSIAISGEPKLTTREEAAALIDISK